VFEGQEITGGLTTGRLIEGNISGPRGNITPLLRPQQPPRHSQRLMDWPVWPVGCLLHFGSCICVGIGQESGRAAIWLRAISTDDRRLRSLVGGVLRREPFRIEIPSPAVSASWEDAGPAPPVAERILTTNAVSVSPRLDDARR